MSLLLYRIGRFCFRARRLVLALWIAAIVALGASAAAWSAPSVTTFSLPGTESQRALDLVESRFGESLDRGTARVVFTAEDGQITSEGLRAQVDEVIAELAAAPEVAAVSDPYEAQTVSPDGRIMLAEVGYETSFAEIDGDSRAALLDIVDDAGGAGLQVDVGGDAVESEPEVGAELVGLAIAALVLFLTFGSLTAAGMPLATGLAGVAIGLLGILTATGFMDLGATTPILALMLGLAVGIDYALFIVSRHRHELQENPDPAEAAGRAVGTAGSAVVFAGLTVVIALTGLSVVGIGLLTEMGLAAALTVVVAVLAALTLLPALLGFAGRRVAPRRRPDPSTQPRSLGASWAARVVRRPGRTLVLAVGALIVVMLPALDLRLGLPDQGTYPEHTTQRQAYDAISEGFGAGVNGPLMLVADAADSTDPDAAVAEIGSALDDLTGIAAVAPPQPNPDGDTALIPVIPATGPDSADTAELVDRMRSELPAVADGHGAEVAVTGNTALLIDFNEKMAEVLWIYLAIVIGLSLLLLTAVFRSIIVPLKATLGFLLSVGVTFGALVAIFQWGWLEPIGIEPTGVVVSMLPIFIIGVVFGLAMDYEVFLVSRMREEYVHGASATDAVQLGYRHGARVVAAAAIIMTCVFGGFALGDAADVIQIGVALAVAVAVDAFVVRMTIVPAVLALLGDRAWWLPRWLDRLLPNLDIEGEALRRELQPARG